MSEPVRTSPTGNPFSTRRVRPGAIPFCFPEGVDAETLVARLRKSHWRGQIVGPHGSGKSALLATLIPAIEQAARRVVSIELHDNQRRLPSGLTREARLDASCLLVIDGFEQLRFMSRLWIKRRCAVRGVGLLVTAHAPVGLSTLWTTSTDRELARLLVRQLLGDAGPSITSDDVDTAFSRHAGNLRETLFALYDLYESRR